MQTEQEEKRSKTGTSSWALRIERSEPGSEEKGRRVGVGVKTARAQVTSTRPASGTERFSV